MGECATFEGSCGRIEPLPALPVKGFGKKWRKSVLGFEVPGNRPRGKGQAPLTPDFGNEDQDAEGKCNKPILSPACASRHCRSEPIQRLRGFKVCAEARNVQPARPCMVRPDRIADLAPGIKRRSFSLSDWICGPFDPKPSWITIGSRCGVRPCPLEPGCWPRLRSEDGETLPPAQVRP